VIADPRARGRALAEFYLAAAPRLFAQLEESGTLGGAPPPTARREWECFALYACVRGLVAAGGFNRETAFAIDALHERVLEAWGTQPDAVERRRRVAERYAEYGAIGQEHEAKGAATVTGRLGRAAALHLAPGADPDALGEVAGGLHESLAEGAAESVRAGS
jgi:hypothetical protein